MSATRKKYDAQYFIEFFSAIPASRWTTLVVEDQDGRKCALGHLGINNETYWEDQITPRIRALSKVLRPEAATRNSDLLEVVWRVNDYGSGKTPRGAILSALKAAKKAGR